MSRPVVRSSIARQTRRADLRREFDRETWATPTVTILSYDTTGSGVIETELIDFGLVYDDVPFFSYGVENYPNQTLVSGDFPEITAGVKQWHTAQVGEDDRAVPLYLGAFLWISIKSNTTYKLRFRFAFEGPAFRDVEYLKGF